MRIYSFGALYASVLGPERMILKTELDVHIFNTKPETPCKRIKGQLSGFFPPWSARNLGSKDDFPTPLYHTDDVSGPSLACPATALLPGGGPGVEGRSCSDAMVCTAAGMPLLWVLGIMTPKPTVSVVLAPRSSKDCRTKD